jgi:hypothetical protein
MREGRGGKSGSDQFKYTERISNSENVSTSETEEMKERVRWWTGSAVLRSPSKIIPQ